MRSPDQPSIWRRHNMVRLLGNRLRELPDKYCRLVATLGSKSTLKKVTRKAILDVDIPKACQTITNPETPLALRLQASLL